MTSPKQEDDKHTLVGLDQGNPTKAEQEAGASEEEILTAPTDTAEDIDIESEANALTTDTMPKTDDETASSMPQSTRKEIREEDTYYQCPLCDYVNKHANDIGGRHFKKAHQGTE